MNQLSCKSLLTTLAGGLFALWVVLCHPIFASGALTVPAEKALTHTEGEALPDGGWNLWSSGAVEQPLRVRTAGIHKIVIRGWGSPAGGVWPEMALQIDGRVVSTTTVGRGERADYPFSAELSAGIHEIGAAFLNDALVGQEDRNLYLDRFTIHGPPGGDDPVLATKEEITDDAEQREQQIVAGTQAAIEKYRKGDVTVRLLDAAGGPLPAVKVSIEQTGHDFLFGCNIYGFDALRSAADNAAYKARFQELFNYATVGFYWQDYEPERGKPNYARTDKIVDWCRSQGIRMKGHPLLWGHPAGIPRWSQGQPSPEIQRQRVEDIIHRYRDRIEFWEVVNEAGHLPEPKVDEPYRWARQADPRAYLIINDFAVLWNGAPGVFDLLTKAKQSGVPFDGIGIQAHEPLTMRFPLGRVQKILDQYATLGKELHITEFTPLSSGKPIIGSHREGTWDEAAQADYAVKFYRVCFAHPALRAITWWDLCDQSCWQPGGGMLRADLSPKPVYEQLKRLIHEEWQTRLSTQTDAQGELSFRGFFGTYRLVIETPQGKIQREIHLASGGPKKIIVSLSGNCKPEIEPCPSTTETSWRNSHSAAYP